jgi:hypothetical protein
MYQFTSRMIGLYTQSASEPLRTTAIAARVDCFPVVVSLPTKEEAYEL